MTRSDRSASKLRTPMLWKSKYRRVKQLSIWYKERCSGRTIHRACDETPLNISFPVADVSETEEVAIEIESEIAQMRHGTSVDSHVSRKEAPLEDSVRNGSTSSVKSDCMAKEIVGKRACPDSPISALAIAFSGRKLAKMVSEQTADAPESASRGSYSAPSKIRLDPCKEIDRILEAQSPEDILNVRLGSSEEIVNQAWKQLVLLLHPDKLQCLGEDVRESGAQALHFVHSAKEEMKRQYQEHCVEVPTEPVPDGIPKCLSRVSGARKYEIRWTPPDCQNPERPVEKYEIWGPKYFSEQGEPFDWVMLASLPPLQTHFVLVEEAPTQQDAMWAADRVLRATLPLAVNAVNGKGASTPLTFELPWATEFPWLQGTPSVICPRCCQLSQRRGAWSKCGGCGFSVPAENSLVLRCPECQGEVLWSHRGAELSCSCCFKKFGGAAAQDKWKRPQPPKHAPPNSGQGPWFGRAGGNFGSRSGGTRYKHN